MTFGVCAKRTRRIFRVKPGGTAGFYSCPSMINMWDGSFFVLFSRSRRQKIMKGEKTMKQQAIPYKIYLSENEIPKYWYNMRADMKVKPAPLLNPGTLKPMTAAELSVVFCDELVAQELNNDDRLIEIPDEIRNFYKMYRPAPLVRAYCLEKKLNTPAHIYYKFEGKHLWQP
jgi:hypothetical protein